MSEDSFRAFLSSVEPSRGLGWRVDRVWQKSPGPYVASAVYYVFADINPMKPVPGGDFPDHFYTATGATEAEARANVLKRASMDKKWPLMIDEVTP